MSDRFLRRLGAGVLYSGYGYVILAPALPMMQDGPPTAVSKLGSALLLLYPTALQVLAVTMRVVVGEAGGAFLLPRARKVSGVTVCAVAMLAATVLKSDLAGLTYPLLREWARSPWPSASGLLFLLILAFYENREYRRRQLRRSDEVVTR